MVEDPVKAVMQANPVTVPPDMRVRELAELFADQGLPFAPVIDGERLVGVVSEADLVLQEVAGDDLHVPYAVPFLGDLVFIEGRRRFEERYRKAFGATVSDLMTRDPVTIGPDATVHDAARLLAEHHVARLPVLDDDGRLLGTIGRSEVVRALARTQFDDEPIQGQG
jgi:CBS domain-containing protein